MNETRPVPKARFKEFSMATKLLEEAKQEINKLEKRNNDLAIALTELYDWAVETEKKQESISPGEIASSKDTSGLDISIKPDANISIEVRKNLAEYFCPMNSNEAEKLQKENEELKNTINLLQSKSTTSKQIYSLQNEVKSLKTSNKSKEETIIRITKELSDCKQLLNSSSHEKEAEILKLRAIVNKRKSNTGLEKIRKTLNEETEILKKRLVETAAMCDQFIPDDKVESNSVTPTKLSNNAQNKIAHVHPTTVAVSGSAFSNFTLSNDVSVLQEQLKDALDKNFRWQHYNSSREEYVKNLLHKYGEVTRKLQASQTDVASLRSNPDQLSSEQRKYFDGLLVQAKNELEKSRSDTYQVSTELNILKKRHDEEMIRLQKETDHWRDRYEEQREANARLSAECENERRRSSSSIAENNDKNTQIQFLQRQVHLYSEDFRTERKEKEELKHEVKSLKREIVDLNRKRSLSKKNPVIGHQNSFSDHDVLDIKENNFVYEREVNNDTNHYDKNNYNVLSPPKMLKSSEKVSCSKPPRRPAPPTPLLTQKSENARNKSAAPYSEKKRKDDYRNKKQQHKNTRDNGSEYRRKLYPFLSDEDNSNSSSSRKLRPDRTQRQNKHRSQDVSRDHSTEQLECPNCGKKYDVDEHMLLLSHIDICD